jgi:ATP-dependent Clp protease, protease subunit
MSEKPQAPQSGLEANGKYLFMEQVTSASLKPVVTWILEENLAKKKKQHLQLIINSPGGDLNACFALIDVMKGSKIPVHTLGIGMIASCGLLMFMSGEKGHRVLTPNTSILSHQYSWGSHGKEHELMSTVTEFDLTTERMIDHYKKCTGLTEAKIRQHLLPESDVWLSAREAKKYGIADKISAVY